MADSPGVIGQVVEAVVRIADSLDRAVALLEDLAAAVELPALNRDALTNEDLEDEEGAPDG